MAQRGTIAIPYSERKCLPCNKLEDEFHLMPECPLYEAIKKRYIKEYL